MIGCFNLSDWFFQLVWLVVSAWMIGCFNLSDWLFQVIWLVVSSHIIWGSNFYDWLFKLLWLVVSTWVIGCFNLSDWLFQLEWLVVSGHLIVSPESLPPRARNLYKQVKEFIKTEVAPVEQEYVAHSQSDDKWKVFQPMDKLKVTW